MVQILSQPSPVYGNDKWAVSGSPDPPKSDGNFNINKMGTQYLDSYLNLHRQFLTRPPTRIVPCFQGWRAMQTAKGTPPTHTHTHTSTRAYATASPPAHCRSSLPTTQVIGITLMTARRRRTGSCRSHPGPRPLHSAGRGNPGWVREGGACGGCVGTKRCDLVRPLFAREGE